MSSSDRAVAWQRRAEAATGSRPVGPREGPGAGVLDDIDALLAEEDIDSASPDSPNGAGDREPPR
ncbi:hypothetical protein LWC33_26665 [Pseudonocardia sp. RS11V-5]|uniref:hypothetical protein n=1 Tax=Pseudonocardia terrae TaxID=2905831 RepID=UPI001E6117BE|nr:hypothetical protein [Pseudonocardia terrae]MCE3555024.1 hypothetical protein [Pseudonocardia terrae]